MSKYLTLCNEYQVIGLFSKAKSTYLKGRYNKLNDENKATADKHAELLLKRSLDEVPRVNLASIKGNIQLLTWITIFNLICLSIGIFIMIS